MFYKSATAIHEQVIEWRRHLHQYPELSHEEKETREFICRVLDDAGIAYETMKASYGVIGIIKGEKPGKTVALRADMDALPIRETNDVPYRSKKERVMHACGHDAHTAMLLGTGVTLQENKDEIAGTILLLFQPAEEDAPIGGAQAMMEDPAFLQWKPDAIFGQHVWPDLPVGQIGVRDGAMMGNSDRFSIVINGRAGHASMPHQGIDAIVVANQVMSSLQTIVSRNVDPLDAAVITVGKITGGDRYNVIASEVVLEGTVRTLSLAVREQVEKRLVSLVEQVAAGLGAKASVTYQKGYVSTINTSKWASHIKEQARHLFGEGAAPDIDPSLAGEDFGRFLQTYPGAYFWLGTAIKERSVQSPLHDASFDIDEEALVYGVNLMATTAVTALEQLKREES
ncbi:MULTISPECIES: M20 metallopeptidase family protein [Shouchella]|uniref:Amidohydrolase n=1 Tax=Shouchella hunanensis TaxID=766894 RepID=A0ABY7W3L0_9BACI|nr:MULTISPECIES: amidohydrolase [Shouchella]WDF03258.1 amidohydrolase [Shouchella hunanensis]GAF24457.1 N-acetyl-L,L-diaminopimelate deacetylase [Bacillus sp. JCM 19047]